MISRPSFLPLLTTSCLLLVPTACSQKGSHGSSDSPLSCSEGLASECAKLKTDIDKLQKDRDDAIAAKDLQRAVALGLETNYKIELLDLFREAKPNGNERQALDQRYERLKTLLAPKDKFDETALTCPSEVSDTCSHLKGEIQGLYRDREAAKAKHDDGQWLDLTLGINYRSELITLLQAGKNNSDDHRFLNRLYDSLSQLIDRTAIAAGLPNGVTSQGLCPAKQAEECRQLEYDLVRLRRDRDAALEKGDKQKASTYMLEINYKNELLDRYHAGKDADSNEVKQVNSRYAALLKLFGNSAGLKPYTERESNSVNDVFKDFGDLYISETSQMESVSAGDTLPWSDFWYPSRYDTMYRDANSPLGKFDRLVAAMGRSSNTVSWEKGRRDPNTAEWAGLCDAWAMASMLTKEPRTALTFHDIRFEITDLKALLIKSYEGYRPKFYGVRYTGTYETDGEYQDLRPEAFHRLVQAVIGDQKSFIGLDDDPGPEVWNKPMFRMDWKVQKDSTHPHAYVVTAFPKMIKNRGEIDPRPTSLNDMKAPKYEYRLYVDPNQERHGQYRVIYGEWIGSSLNEHPDMVFLPQNQVLTPTNKDFANNLDILNQLFSQGVPSP